MADTSKQAQVVLPPVCNLCRSENDVSWFCVSCGEILCLSCRIAHQNSLKTKNDRVISLSEARRDRLLGFAEQEVCNLHSGKILDIFCETCFKLICSKCLSKSHKDHKWLHLDEAQVRIKTVTENNIKMLNEKLQRLKQNEKENCELYSDFNKTIGGLKAKVRRRSETLKQAFADKCEQYLSALERSRVSEDETFSEIQSKILKSTKLLEEHIQELERILHSSCIASMVQLLKEDQTTTFSTDENISYEKSQIPTLDEGEDSPGCLEKLFGSLKCNKTPSAELNRIIKTDNQGIVRKICPSADDTAWILYDKDSAVELIDNQGNQLERVDFGEVLSDVALSKSGTLFASLLKGQAIYRKSSGRMSILASFKPHNTKGICTRNDTLLICVCGKNKKASEIHIVSQNTGELIQKVGFSFTGERLYVTPGRLTSLPNGNLVVIDYKFDDNDVRVITLDVNALNVVTWRGENTELTGLFDITSDEHNNCFLTDCKKSDIYIIPKGKYTGERISVQGLEVKVPGAITVVRPGEIWIGDNSGLIHILKYSV